MSRRTTSCPAQDRPADRFLRGEGAPEALLHRGGPAFDLSGTDDPPDQVRGRLRLIAGYCFAIRSERRLCDEVHLNLAYRWFCRLGLEGAVPDHSTFSRNRHGRFRESDLFRTLFDEVLRRCLAGSLVCGEAFSVDGSLVAADADRRKGPTGEAGLPPDKTSGAIVSISPCSMTPPSGLPARRHRSSCQKQSRPRT